MSQRLSSALGCSALGLSVIPVKREDKRPFIKWEQHQSTPATQEQIQKWWQQWPDANVAVVTGFLSGVFVLDVDGDVGAETLANLQKQHGSIPTTWRSRTGRGEHIWFRFPADIPDEEFANSASRLGPGLDTRGQGGYVIAPGSEHANGNLYEWQDDAAPDLTELANMPAWLLDLVRKPKLVERKANTHAPADLKQYELCRRILEEERAFVFKAGSGQRNHQLNKSAFALAQLAHYGAYNESEVHGALFGACQSNGYIGEDGPAAFEASFQSGWKDGLSDPRELKAREPQLQREPFRQDTRPEPADAENLPQIPLKKLIVPAATDIRPRPWLLGYWMMRGAVTLLAAPGGTGKTSLLTSMILASATGRDLIGAKPLRPLTVAFLGLEESEEEIHRRFAAAMMHYEIPPAEIDGRIYYLDGRSHHFSAAWVDDGGNVNEGPQVAELTAWLQTIGADLLFADPLALAHSAPENDNTAMARVLGIFSGIAAACDCGVGIIHHTRKGAVAGDPDGIRGAGALVNHARIALGLSPIDEASREQFKLSKEDARGLVRIDDLKLNYSPKAAECRWVRLESVALGNKTGDYPYGDSIQVPVQWDPPDTESLFSPSIANECLDIIDKGLGTERYSAANASQGKAAFKVVQHVMRSRGNEMSDGEARKIIKNWLSCNPPILREESYKSEDDRKHRLGLFVNNGARP